MSITQKDIAEKAGVSQKTVSLFFNGDSRIAPETAANIEKIANKYGYIPNLAARSMKTKCFKRIALVIGIRNQGLILNPHLLTYINNAAEEMAKSGYLMVLETMSIDIKTRQLIKEPEVCKTLSVDAIVGIPGVYIPPEVDQKIADIGVPAIWLNRYPVPKGIQHIYFDEIAHGEIIGNYLKQKGYTNIAWFGPDFNTDIAIHYSSRDRFIGLEKICAANKIKLKSYFNHVGKELIPVGQQILNQPHKPQAVVCYNFDYADSINFLLMQNGLKHPTDIEVVKFASLWEENYGTKGYFTSLLLPESELSRRGVQYLLSKLRNESNDDLLKPIKGKLVPAMSEYKNA